MMASSEGREREWEAFECKHGHRFEVDGESVHDHTVRCPACGTVMVQRQATSALEAVEAERDRAFEEGRLDGFQRGLEARDEQIRAGRLPKGIEHPAQSRLRVAVEALRELLRELADRRAAPGRTRGANEAAAPPSKAEITARKALASLSDRDEP